MIADKPVSGIGMRAVPEHSPLGAEHLVPGLAGGGQ